MNCPFMIFVLMNIQTLEVLLKSDPLNLEVKRTIDNLKVIADCEGFKCRFLKEVITVDNETEKICQFDLIAEQVEDMYNTIENLQLNKINNESKNNENEGEENV